MAFRLSTTACEWRQWARQFPTLQLLRVKDTCDRCSAHSTINNSPCMQKTLCGHGTCHHMEGSCEYTDRAPTEIRWEWGGHERLRSQNRCRPLHTLFVYTMHCTTTDYWSTMCLEQEKAFFSRSYFPADFSWRAYSILNKQYHTVDKRRSSRLVFR
jgi:hypothetical protein